MADSSLQYQKEKEALETLINSEEFKEFCGDVEFIGASNPLRWLTEYYDSLCLHQWRVESHDNHDDEDYVREVCTKCKAEREGTTRRNS